MYMMHDVYIAILVFTSCYYQLRRRGKEERVSCGCCEQLHVQEALCIPKLRNKNTTPGMKNLYEKQANVLGEQG